MYMSQIMQIAQVEEVTGFHRSTLRRWWDQDKFPRPTRLNGTTLIWNRDIINKWVCEAVGAYRELDMSRDPG